MKLDQIKKLHQKKYRQSLGHYLVEGEHLVQELEKTSLQQCQVLVGDEHQHWPTRFEKTLLTGKQMSAISETRSPQGIVAVVPMAATLQLASQPATGKPLKTLYLWEVQDPGNLGTILRTLAWFGGWRCLLSPGSVDPFNAKVIRSSMGALFHVPIEQDVPLTSLRERCQHLACLDMGGVPLHSTGFVEHDCYLFGNEGRGIPRQQLDQLGDISTYRIEGQGAIESLNLASAVNICVYECQRPT